MISRFKIVLLLSLLLISFVLPTIAAAQSSDEDGVVRAVLFFSPTCPHCHTVIDEVLVPMSEEYGGQLQVLGIDTTQETGGQFYQSAIERFEIPAERRGVPTLIIGDVVLVGSGEIPAEFPDLVEQHLADGGLAWPDIPGLVEAIELKEADEAAAEETEEAEAQPTEEVAVAPTEEASVDSTPTSLAEATDTPIPTAESSVQTISKESVPAMAETEAPPSDPVGMGLAAIILIGMAASLLWVIWRLIVSKPPLLQFGNSPANQIASWAIPVLSIIGLGVSIYLAYVEINHVDAVCGPVGECNIVQSSEYARLFGVPIAVWGTLNYVALMVLWVVQKFTSGSLAGLSVLGLVVLTIWSTLFSIYLTLLEIFVIEAVCIWCLTSAVISTALMLLVLIPVTSSRKQ